MIKVIAINFGFAEDGQVGHVFFTTDKEFATEREACVNLAKNLFEKFKNDKEYEAKYAYARDARGNYLRDENGHMVRSTAPADLSEEAFTYFLKEIGKSTADDFGGDEIENWWPWHSFKDILHFKKDEFAILDSYTLHEGRAEEYLAYLVFEEKHKERIKNCKKCGGLGFICSHGYKGHFVWNCCAPFWERADEETKKEVFARCPKQGER